VARLEGAVGGIPVFLCTSAEVAEGKGDVLRSCTQMMCTESVRGRSQRWAVGKLEVQLSGEA
jgi:hypothetical protein